MAIQISSSQKQTEIRGLSLVAVRIFKFFASLQLAISILIVMMAVLAAGTILESMHGADTAKLVVYQSWWFSLLLLVLGINLAAAAVDRLPWKLKHVGFVITHLGIILILFGSFMTQKMMVDGQMVLAEGETGHRISLPEPILYLFSEKEHKTWFFDLNPHPFPWQGEDSLDHSNDGEPGPFPIKVLAYYPKAKASEAILPAASGTPAARVRLKNSFMEQEQWLFQDDPEHGKVQMGPVTLSFSQEPLKEIKTEFSENKANYLEFKFTEKTIPLILKSDLKVPAQLALEGTPYKIEILRVLRNAAVEGKKLVEQAEPAVGPGRNPAIEFILRGPEIEEKHTVFSNFPDFPTIHGMAPSKINAKIHYRLPNAGSKGETHEIRFVSTEPRAKGEGENQNPLPSALIPMPLLVQIQEGLKLTSQEAQKGAEIQTGWMGGLTVTLEEFYPAAERKISFSPTANNSENPEAVSAIQVRFSDQVLWLRQGEEENAEIGGSGYTLVYGQKQIPAGFKLQLKDFRLTEYPGTNQPASFESDVILKDDSRGLVKETTISMNKPLEYQGYHIYQSGYSLPQEGSGQAEISIFSVGKDPGVPLKYLGAIVMVAGIITLYYTRRFSTTAGRNL